MSISWLSYANPFSKQINVEAKSINSTLAKQFPFEKKYEGIIAIFSDPQIDINVLDDDVELNIIITTHEGDKNLRAKGTLIGKVEFHDFDKILRFRKPKLDSFIIVEDTLVDNKMAVKVIKQSIGSDFRDLTLFEFKNLKLDRQVSEPKEIEVSTDRLIIHW